MRPLHPLAQPQLSAHATPCDPISYHGAQIFEAIGLGGEIISKSFKGTPSRIGGLTTADLAEEVAEWHETAFGAGEAPSLLKNYGFVKFYQRKVAVSLPLSGSARSALAACCCCC
eukprot:5785429-Prymnesium_polylepis.1